MSRLAFHQGMVNYHQRCADRISAEEGVAAVEKTNTNFVKMFAACDKGSPLTAEEVARIEESAVDPTVEEETLAYGALSTLSSSEGRLYSCPLETVGKVLRFWSRCANGYRHTKGLGITTLDAKWLDPICHTGCTSLVLKNRITELKERIKELVAIIEANKKE